jgi:predicted nuclease with RNAse H fold
MITAGIDLAAEPKNTGICRIRWESGIAAVELLKTGATDTELVDLVENATKTGIDAPFGWPDEFVDAVVAHRNLEAWPGREYGSEPKNFRSRLSYRETDRAVKSRGKGRPLSVSTDKLGVTTMRCALLLDRLALNQIPASRSGEEKVAEVYPAAALRCWDLPLPGSYKDTKGKSHLSALASELNAALPALSFPEKEYTELFASNDDAFDAVIAALVARAVALRLTLLPPDDQRERALREGWIHLPEPGSLALLA